MADRRPIANCQFSQQRALCNKNLVNPQRISLDLNAAVNYGLSVANQTAKRQEMHDLDAMHCCF